MTVTEIKAIAKDMGISAGKMAKTELVRTIQEKEGNFPCFETATAGECDRLDCRWRKDCLK